MLGAGAMLEAAAAGAASVVASPSLGVEAEPMSRKSRFRLPGGKAARRSRSEDGDSDSDDEVCLQPATLFNSTACNPA